jgi:hypothetical protein
MTNSGCNTGTRRCGEKFKGGAVVGVVVWRDPFLTNISSLSDSLMTSPQPSTYNNCPYLSPVGKKETCCDGE